MTWLIDMMVAPVNACVGMNSWMCLRFWKAKEKDKNIASNVDFLKFSHAGLSEYYTNIGWWRMVSWSFTTGGSCKTIKTGRGFSCAPNNKKWWVSDCAVSVMGRPQALYCSNYSWGSLQFETIFYLHSKFFLSVVHEIILYFTGPVQVRGSCFPNNCSSNSLSIQ